MPLYPETVQTRAPAGTVSAIEQLARNEGKKFGEVVREALALRLNAALSSADREAA